ncbi:hypothetical protein EDD16DRAFT_1431163, partial [Pisolithus croceorrhizus]
CAVCLGRHRHLIECRATQTWDRKHKAFSERVYKALFAKDGHCICAKQQWEEGCTEHHDSKHLCSGCRATSHGAQKCPCTQK